MNLIFVIPWDHMLAMVKNNIVTIYKMPWHGKSDNEVANNVGPI